MDYKVWAERRLRLERQAVDKSQVTVLSSDKVLVVIERLL